MASLLQILLFFAFMNFFSSSSAEISRKEVRSKETIQENLVKSSRIDPSRVVQLSWQPRVFVYRDFISEEDCDHLISLAHGQSEGANSVVSDTQGLSTRSLVTLDVKDEVVARIEEKISAWTLLPLENSRALEVQHYGNEEAKQKNDYFGNQSAWQVSEPLMATVILFLSDVSRGGEISFPESQLKASRLRTRVWSTNHDKLLRPIKGNAILFFSVRPNASPDKSSRHERNPVLEGELWCATKFFHIRSIVSKRNILSESDNSDCSDEDENCPQWAALGECQKNPTFMVGSPDYYGTCRRSCHVC
ncbi:probable prolyl 4-hydroxylase 12 isoform X2 [Chenopodium quinoa]|uniref:probable prolyl 4-hydroxylase 12 isoform X2 n=1 Tax=Chenopodium quinoa TaxID=63459 RepID=UPI000B777D22|nr:probable prolyl 4-hydroxylase 12 isoform X2 [Chenopodium quinoa]